MKMLKIIPILFLSVFLLPSCILNQPSITSYLITLLAQWPQETSLSDFSYSDTNSVYTVGQKIQDNTPIITGSVSSYKTVSSLPSGLSLDTSSGIISGTPTIKQDATVYTIQASNEASSISVSIQITIIGITTASIPTTTTSNDSNFVDNLNGTVSDISKGLTWMKCSQGQAWNSISNDCSGSVGTFQYCTSQNESCNDTSTKLLNGAGASGAWDNCNILNSVPTGGFSGRTNWRVPTPEELVSLVYCSTGPNPLTFGSSCDSNSSYPAIDSSMFPNTPGSEYWTSMTESWTAAAWYIHFYNGARGSYTKDTYIRLRCVSPN